MLIKLLSTIISLSLFLAPVFGAPSRSTTNSRSSSSLSSSRSTTTTYSRSLAPVVSRPVSTPRPASIVSSPAPVVNRPIAAPTSNVMVRPVPGYDYASKGVIINTPTTSNPTARALPSPTVRSYTTTQRTVTITQTRPLPTATPARQKRLSNTRQTIRIKNRIMNFHHYHNGRPIYFYNGGYYNSYGQPWSTTTTHIYTNGQQSVGQWGVNQNRKPGLNPFIVIVLGVGLLGLLVLLIHQFNKKIF